LKHDHIVDVTDFGIDPRAGGMPYLVLEYLNGETLAQKLRKGPITVTDALPILKAIASAIDFAHQHGILHRDIKPENIFLVRHETGLPRVKVLDFGVACVGDEETARREPTTETAPRLAQAAGVVVGGRHSIDDDLDVTETFTLSRTAPNARVGTLPYMAPELFNGERASRASDLYAFGVVAYESLVGKRPYLISNIASARNELKHEAPSAHEENTALDPNISRALARALSHSPSARPSSACEFVGGLLRAHYDARCWAWKQTESPRRRRLSVLVAVLVAAAAWVADYGRLLSPFEQRLVDTWFHLVPKLAPDPRLIVVAVDDLSLAQDPTVLGERADEFGERLEQMFAAGASGVAIDFLLPERWSTSSRFSRFVLTHADQLALGAMSAPNGSVIGPECLTGLTAAALGPQRSAALFGFTNLEPDSDGVIRHGRALFRDAVGAFRDSFPARSIRAGFGDGALSKALARRPKEAGAAPFRIDASIDTSRIRVVSWNSVQDSLEREPALFRDRLVMVGGDFLGSGDAHRYSGSDTLVPGVLLQALIANSILGGLRVRDVGITLLLPVIGLCAWAAAYRILQSTQSKMPVWTLALTAAWLLASTAAFVSGKFVIPVLLPLATVVAASGIAAGVRRFLPSFPEREE
jgi:CHASE2 domain-containing sensor protein